MIAAAFIMFIFSDSSALSSDYDSGGHIDYSVQGLSSLAKSGYSNPVMNNDYISTTSAHFDDVTAAPDTPAGSKYPSAVKLTGQV